MGWPKLLVFVRHAESVGNVLNVDERAQYGVATHEYALTERGREQARITGEFLRKYYGEFQVYYTSYYTRSKETMEYMFPGVPYYEDSRLAEGQRGMYHTMTFEQIQRRFPEELLRKEREGLYHYRPWGGENWPDIELRVHSFLGTLARDYEGESVCIVVHGHWFTIFEKLVHHFSIEEALRRYKEDTVGNASVTIYEGATRKGKSRLLLLKRNIIPWEGKL